MRWLCTALIAALAVPAAAANDDEAPPKLLSPAESRDRDLLRRSDREAVTAVSLLSTGGMLELQAAAAFFVIMFDSARLGSGPACAGCGPDAESRAMLGAAVPIMLVGGSLGLTLAVKAREHKRVANRWLTAATTLTLRF